MHLTICYGLKRATKNVKPSQRVFTAAFTAVVSVVELRVISSFFLCNGNPVTSVRSSRRNTSVHTDVKGGLREVSPAHVGEAGAICSSDWVPRPGASREALPS